MRRRIIVRLETIRISTSNARSEEANHTLNTNITSDRLQLISEEEVISVGLIFAWLLPNVILFIK